VFADAGSGESAASCHQGEKIGGEGNAGHLLQCYTGEAVNPIVPCHYGEEIGGEGDAGHLLQCYTGEANNPIVPCHQGK
jgi:hypothetical protein